MTLSDTATPGLLDRLVTKRFPRALRELDPGAKGWRLTGGSVAGIGADWQATERYRYEPGVREMWEDLCTVLARSGRGGVLITIDEVHGDRAGKVRGELRDLGTAFQHLRGEQHQVAFVAAGLPNAVEDVLNDDVLTFLRRGARYDLAMIGEEDRRYALHEPIRAHGRSITAEALDYAAGITEGYPFMIQMMGAEMWRLSNETGAIDDDVARRAARRALPRMAQLVFDPVLANLSSRSVDFLTAMAVDDGPSRIRNLQQRLDVDGNYANQYRSRLLAAEIIRPAGHGAIDFAMPYLRHYLRSGRAPSGTPELGSAEVAKVFEEWGSKRPPEAIERGVDLD